MTGRMPSASPPAGVLANNLLRPGFGTFALDGGFGVGTDEGEVVGRAGASFGW